MDKFNNSERRINEMINRFLSIGVDERKKTDLLLGIFINKVSRRNQKKRKQTQIFYLPFCDSIAWRDSKSAFPKPKNILKLCELTLIDNNRTEEDNSFALFSKGKNYEFSTLTTVDRQTLVDSIRILQGNLPHIDKTIEIHKIKDQVSDEINIRKVKNNYISLY